MARVRLGLLAVSAVAVALILGGGVALKVGAADAAYRHVLDFSEVFSLVVENYVDEVDQESLVAGAYHGLLGGLDSRGAYLTPAEAEAWKKEAPGPADPGLVVLKTGPSLQVVAVLEGSPAAEAKVVPGDQIRRIGGRSVRDLSLDQAVRFLRGPAGSTVDLAIIRSRENFRKEDLSLTRALRREPSFSLTVERDTAVLTLRDLARVPVGDVADGLRSLKGRGAARLLVDLRSVAEGTPRDATRVLAPLAPGETIRLRDRGGKVVESVGVGGKVRAWDGPIAVLVNAATAGGSEAIVRVLQGARGALVLGETTFGLGTEPRFVPIPEGGALLLSTQLWETGAGKGWNGDGIAPDRVVRGEGKPEDVEADQLRRAIEEFGKAEAAPAKAAA